MYLLVKSFGEYCFLLLSHSNCERKKKTTNSMYDKMICTYRNILFLKKNEKKKRLVVTTL